MAIVELIQHIVTTILIGYLSVTNSLAGYIESIILPQEEIYPSENEEISYGERFEKVVALAEKYTGQVPRVLLDNASFQRAAVIASNRTEEVPPPQEGRSAEMVIKDSLVNIYCQYQTDTHIRTTTGTGFFINQKGVILTNAHVAQFLLLEGTEDVISDAECVIRSGDPATPKYKAKLLYISPTWIYENAHLIDNEAPRGTGERDYALLYISESIDGTPLPTHFPFIVTDTNLLSRGIIGNSIFGAGYPAQKLILEGPNAELVPIVAEASVQSLYTFGSNYADIFSISDSSVGAQGASGGPIINDTQSAIGIIVTKGDEATEGAQSLRAITLSYIDRTIQEETGFSLTQNMLGDVAYRGHIFKQAIGPFLTQLLEDELQ